MSNIIRINLCGRTQVVSADGVVVDKLGGVKPRQVLEMLALSVGRPLSKDRLAQLLWDEEPPPSYVGTLESYVCVLRRMLGSKGRDSVIETTTTGYLLRRDRVVVDIDMAKRLLARARTAPAVEAARLVDSAFGLLEGELLASEPNAPWAAAHRAAHERETADLLTDVATSALAAGEPALALRLAAAVTRRDTLAERAWQIQLRALMAQHRFGEALAGYAALREALREELGAEPTTATQALYQQMLAGTRGTGTEADTKATSRAELATLVRLLRQALEATPGIRVPDRDEPLTALACHVLQTA